MSQSESRGLFFEDYQVGRTFRHWPRKTILDADNHWFTLLTLNSHPLHFDEVYAGESEWGRTLVNSCYTLALVVGMTVRDISQNAVANLGFEEVRFTKPVYAGDTVQAETTILDKRLSRSRRNCGILKVETRGVNQRGEIVVILRRNVLTKGRYYDVERSDGGDAQAMA